MALFSGRLHREGVKKQIMNGMDNPHFEISAEKKPLRYNIDIKIKSLILSTRNQ